MANKRLFLLVGVVFLLVWILPVEGVSSQSDSSEPVRVISLAAAGQDRGNAVSFSPDGGHLAVAASSGLYLFNPQTLSQEGFFSTGAWARTLAISPDGSFLAVGLSTGTAHLLAFPTRRPLYQFDDLGGWVRSIVFTPDGQFVAAAAGDAVHVWNTADGTRVLTINELPGVRAIAISPDGETLAVGLQDNSIQLRSLSDGILLDTLVGHEGWIRCLAFSPDGTLLASGAFDATARIWDVSTGRLLHTLTDHQSSVLGISFSPDGATLATGSVDQTVRLWDPITGSLLRTLVGHGGFVYSVAFSPDGKVLASGANDNTVRLWDWNSTSDVMPAPPDTPGDCRLCHHPLNNSNPVAVIDVRCDACHPNGLGMNWCPFFPPSMREDSELEIVAASQEKIGVPVPGRALNVTIFSPANGEVIYSHDSQVAPLLVTGKVESSNLAIDSVSVNLDVWIGEEKIASLSQMLQPNGEFAFRLGVNPHGYMLRINDPAAPLNCAYCHDDFNVQARLPAGDIRLLVTAATSDGDRATDERWIITDVNEKLSADVILTDASSGRPVEGVTVYASTRLYEWRGRTSTAVSHDNGVARLSLEALSQSPTIYEIYVPDQVVNGIYYSSRADGTLTIEPQTPEASPVELKLNSQRGQISGILDSGADIPVTIWAVQLPAGPAFQMQSKADGRFSFTDLPVAKYKVFTDPTQMLGQQRSAQQAVLDLTQSPSASVELQSHPLDSQFSGTITGDEGEWLPFAWLAVQDRAILSVDVRDGDWTSGEKPTQGKSWILSAPGYYSQEVGSAPGQTTVALKGRPDTENVSWGSGEIVVPSETQARILPEMIIFDSGWIWGTNPGNNALVIQTEEGEIHLSSGRFALERHPGGIAWFYLFEGHAELRFINMGTSIPVEPGQMIALSKSGSFSPMRYEPAIARMLRPIPDVPVYLEPTLLEKLKDRSVQNGVIFAQFVTFITYFVAVISLAAIVWGAVRWRYKQQKTPGENYEK